ncbi:tRNA(Ile)-lysidine synthase [Butyrivibrio proteoclasticus]|uniref:tRNA(Ile)-lysidine synthase n=1 Tax=Butyrivibrio proteoclasticus TaxID=43305 RepID=A0A1I5TTZ0_9FIRM|nr:tRNA lysidine(34) synthetase TilS [Butyrivibrio proteoclasticus]SFP86540.1 tRNA(Ile)-lysidine synthase [Butyrivibrio proteoclasticus]
MNNFENKVLNFIRDNQMVMARDKVIVGFSGGADSTALITVLFTLKEILKIEIIAAHVNHGIREEAGEDAEFTRRFCEERGIRYHLLEENVPQIAANSRLSEEEAGRIVRYDFFSQLVKSEGTAKIAIAHHQNDAAETFLHNIFRGSGLRGGGGIRPVRDNIIRPLLCVTRDEIEYYLKEKEISFCTDATNLENIHTRNKLRNKVIPYVEKEINRSAVEHIYRATKDFAMAEDYIRDQAKKVFNNISEKDNREIVLDLKKLDIEPEILKRYVILKCFEELTPNRKDITARHVDALLTLISETDGSASLDLPYNIRAVRSYDKLILLENIENCDGCNLDDQLVIEKLELGDETKLNIPRFGVATIDIMSYNGKTSIPSDTYTKWFDCDRIQEAIFRHRKPDDYICIEQNGAIRKKKLSKFMTDEKIPAIERDNIWILADGDHCIWIPGYRISCSYKISDKTKKILAIAINNGGN